MAVKLKQIGNECFKEIMLEKFVGSRLEIIGIESFNQAYYLKEINLKNVKEIGRAAFYGTSLKTIKNKHVQELKNF